MRMRFKPYARPELLACDFHVHEPLTHGGHWHELYARPDQPWHLELGCGKGGFLAQIAPANPDINYLGIDITDKVLILAKRKVEAAYAVLKDFMYATVYVDKEAKREEKKVDKLISELYARLCDEPALMPNFYMQIAYNEGVDRAVTDYISGMSDEFATRLFEELFVPQKWKVL